MSARGARGLLLGLAALTLGPIAPVGAAPIQTTGAHARPPGQASPLVVTAAHGGGASSSSRVGAPGDGNSLTRPTREDIAPTGFRLSAARVLTVAAALPRVRGARHGRAGTYGIAFEKDAGRWQVSFYSQGGRSEIAQVLIQDASARVLETWTGFQVAWSMARGYPGAFGRRSNTLWLWLVLSVLFVAPFVDRRRPWSLLHLDLLVLSSFSISLAFFNHANIGLSVPLAYPPMIYLLARMVIASRRHSPPARVRLNVPVTWLIVATIFLTGFRVGLNVIDSNVIDVGYAGVIGAHRMLNGQALYGHFPSDNQHGDTYGPVNYEAYVPAVTIAGWSGRWDDLPAGHIAAVSFDLICMLLLFLIGRRVRGPTLGVALAYGWAAWPFTLFALSSDSNDTLVAALVLGALLFAGRPALRGAFSALAGLTKFAPLALVPLMATHGRGEPGATRTPTLRFAVGLALVAALALVPVLVVGGLDHIYDRTVAYQASRGSPFSVWGLWGGLDAVQATVQIGALVFAIGAAFLPRRPDVIGLAALAGAVLIALQLGITHWFYLYLVWFFPLVWLVLLGGGHEDLLDRVGAPTVRAGDDRPHQPGVLL